MSTQTITQRRRIAHLTFEGLSLSDAELMVLGPDPVIEVCRVCGELYSTDEGHHTLHHSVLPEDENLDPPDHADWL